MAQTSKVNIDLVLGIKQGNMGLDISIIQQLPATLEPHHFCIA